MRALEREAAHQAELFVCLAAPLLEIQGQGDRARGHYEGRDPPVREQPVHRGAAPGARTISATAGASAMSGDPDRSRATSRPALSRSAMSAAASAALCVRT